LQVQGSARTLGLKLEIPNVGTENELEAALAIMQQQRVGALLVSSDPTMTSWTERIVALAIQYSYPTMFNVRSYVVAGGLMSYDASITDSFRQAGVYVGRILKGEKPAELPIRNPIKFDFILNLKTAKALGLEIPLKVHAFANEVIE